MLSYYFTSSISVIVIATVIMFGVHFVNEYSGRTEPIIIPLLPCIGLLGAVGAFFSALTRLYDIEELPAALLQTEFHGLGQKHLFMYCLIRPITGVIGAIIFYFILSGGLIAGDFFPEFSCNIDDCGRSLSTILYRAPAEAEDYMKSLVWSFIAGFSERLIPDTLSSLKQRD